MLLQDFEFFRQLRIACLIRVKIHNCHARSMFHFAFAQIMEERSPMFVFSQIVGDAFGEKNVSSVAAIHHPLRHVDSGTGEIGMTVDIDHAADWAAVHSHSKLYLPLFFERATDFERAFYWLFRALVKNQRHPVAGGDLDQSGRSFGVLKLLRRANGLSQFINRRALIVNRKLGVANDVDKQDMGDLELNLFFNFSGHVGACVGTARPR